ncbi:MAG TPA: hypothetical protein VFJ59_02365 [Pseudolabrys sp.]|nr:hypothetical protein [Pseudolabrys sp.]
MTWAMRESQRSTSKALLAEYDSDQYGPLFAVSDEGSAGPVVLNAALSSAKAAAGASSPIRLGVILDGERMTSAGEVPIGPPEYSALSAAAAGQLLLTTNVGTRINVRLTGQLPEFPALEKSAEAVIAAFHQFLDTPDRQPRPLTVRLQLDPGADYAPLAALVGKLDEARKKGKIGPANTHLLSVLVSFKEEIATNAQLEQTEAIIAAAADLGVPEVAIDGAQLPYARRRWGAQGLLNVLSIPASNRLLRFATARGVRLTPRYQVDVNSAARTIWTGLEAARVNGFDAGKYGLLPLTLEEQGQVIELITRWTSGWTAIPAFYVDTPLVTATEVFDVMQCEVAARRWLKAARGAGSTTVLFDAPDRVNPRRLVQGSDSPDGVLTPDQIEALRDYGELLGVKILWSGGITAAQAFDLARRRVFGIFSTSSAAAKIAVTAQFERDPRLAAENEPTEFGVRRMHAITQGGFLSSRMEELHAGLARELETSTKSLVASGGEAAKSRTALDALNELLVRGWRHLMGMVDNTSSQVANRDGCAPRPVPADSVRVFRGRKKAGVRRDMFVQRLGQVFMPITIQMQRLYGLTAYLPAILPESKESTVPDEVALVFYRTQECYREAKRCIGGRAYSELHELAFDMSASRSGFPKLLAADEITSDQPYHLFERSVDWQTGYSRLFVGTRKPDAGSDAFLAGVAKIARQVQADPRSLDAAIFSATSDWVVWWDHSPTGIATGPMHYLDAVADLVHASAARCLRVPPNLLEPYAGLSLNAQTDFLNLQFPRV